VFLVGASHERHVLVAEQHGEGIDAELLGALDRGHLDDEDRVLTVERALDARHRFVAAADDLEGGELLRGQVAHRRRLRDASAALGPMFAGASTLGNGFT
jgi:hypothetical protein